MRTPFVLGGDLSHDELDAWHDDTILPAVRAMQCRYFRSRPNQPITVLLFRGEESYNHYSPRHVWRQRHLDLRLLQAERSHAAG